MHRVDPSALMALQSMTEHIYRFQVHLHLLLHILLLTCKVMDQLSSQVQRRLRAEQICYCFLQILLVHQHLVQRSFPSERMGPCQSTDPLPLRPRLREFRTNRVNKSSIITEPSTLQVHLREFRTCTVNTLLAMTERITLHLGVRGW